MTLLQYIELLETTEKKQIFGAYAKDGGCCAVGLIHCNGGVNDGVSISIERQIIKLTGFGLFFWSDHERLTFKQIAAMLRSKLGGSTSL